MPSISIILAIVVAAVLLSINGCSTTAKPLPSIPGVSTTNITLYIHNDGSGATLDGFVDRGVEKRIAERYVRTTYGLNSVINLISVR